MPGSQSGQQGTPDGGQQGSQSGQQGSQAGGSQSGNSQAGQSGDSGMQPMGGAGGTGSMPEAGGMQGSAGGMGDGSLDDVFNESLGDFDGQMERERSGMASTGQGSARGAGQHIVVRGRPVTARVLTQAVSAGFGGILAEGVRPDLSELETVTVIVTVGVLQSHGPVGIVERMITFLLPVRGVADGSRLNDGAWWEVATPTKAGRL